MTKRSALLTTTARALAALALALAGMSPGTAQRSALAAEPERTARPGPPASTAHAASAAAPSAGAPAAPDTAASAAPPPAPPASSQRPEVQVRDCPGQPVVTVSAADLADIEMACQGARRAIDFLGRAGLQAPLRSRLDIVEQLPGEFDGRAIGCYLPDEMRMLLLSYAAFERVGEWLRVPVERELYRAAATHEMAHAVIGCQPADTPLPVPPHEYVAYVTMFATMDPALRERVLARYPGTGFANVLQVNAIVYLVDPLQFGVDAWRHYLKRRDRAHWLRDIVVQRAIPEFPSGDSP